MIMKNEILKTSIAKCRDCYRCVRHCPVKAIGVVDGQAYIDQDKCILCGTCIQECPQKAKVYQNDIDTVKALLKKGKVIASIAPSFVGVYGGWRSTRLPSALRLLGFHKVEETSVGADLIVKRTKEKLENDVKCGGISSACPVVVNYIETYMPESIDMLTNVVSPMIAHGLDIKQTNSDVHVVFIGPCVAKKAEAKLEKYQGIIDCVITFEELNQWLVEEGIEIKNCSESKFDKEGFTSAAKLFALPGGMLKTASMDFQGNSFNVIHTSGAHNVKMVLEAAVHSRVIEYIEPLFCRGGCIGGPGMGTDKNIFERREDVILYSKMKRDDILPKINPEMNLDTVFSKKNIEIKNPSNQEILAVYEKTGKGNDSLRLNCGACGYDNCEQHAIAVIRGLAEIQMCLPYMRRLAEYKSDQIMENSPNGIVILDENLCILSMNSAFEKYFVCSNAVLGRKISYLVEDKDYIQLSKEEKTISESILKKYGREFHQIVYYLPLEKQYVGTYVDISSVKITESKIKKMHQHMVDQGKILMEHQIEVAQQMAMFLGESTAKTEALIEGLMNENEE